MPTFGENLQRIRRARRLKTKDLAALVRVKSPTISQWEREPVMPETPTLLKLAKALRCSVDALLEGVDEDFERVRDASDLIRHTGDQRSSPPERRADVPASPAVEARDLEPQRYADLVDETEDIATRLLDIAGELRNARLSDQPAQDSQPRSRRRHRKTG